MDSAFPYSCFPDTEISLQTEKQTKCSQGSALEELCAKEAEVLPGSKNQDLEKNRILVREIFKY